MCGKLSQGGLGNCHFPVLPLLFLAGFMQQVRPALLSALGSFPTSPELSGTAAVFKNMKVIFF